VQYLHAHPHKEIVLYFKPDRTLVEADLFLNLPSKEQYSRTSESPTGGLITKVFAWLWKTSGGAGPQRFFIKRVFAKEDRKGFDEGVKRIGQWDFEKVIPCHGDVVEKGGRVVFGKVFNAK
jgi:hypothetical protein